MNIAHLSCGVTGGADIAAVRIHRVLLANGVNSRFYHLGHDSLDHTFTKINRAPRSIATKVAGRLSSYADQLLYGDVRPDTEAFTNPWGNYPLVFDDLQFPDVDVITLHWIASFFDLEKFLSSVPSHIKFVWALHDLNPLTGGCHYTVGCRKFETQCVKCPQLVNNGLVDLALKNFNIKKRVYQKYFDNRLHIVPDSNWVGEEVKRSELLKDYPLTVVNYPIETEIFKPMDKTRLRDELGIDKDKFVLLFGSGSITNERKGMDLLIEACEMLDNDKIQIVTFGSGEFGMHTNVSNIKHFGWVTDQQFLGKLYNIADSFVMPSREEALGQTAMESLCCGTPVIAFRTGGIPDTVNDANGVLAESVSGKALADAIRRAVNTKFDSNSISLNARNRYQYSTKWVEYNNVYQSVLSKLRVP